ncbi:hypothetical protein C8Q80DRAFT_1164904 [Daedaleopsis nitida]|nr:hypothetical protein C8Q80DRAFT_1164904 [Daedaleopsis nitida]
MASSSPNATVPLVLPELPALDDTLGAVLIGTFVSLVLYGLALHQAYQYYVNYQYDKLWLKVYVAIVLFFETLSAVLATHSCYWYAVTNYFKPQTLNMISWSAMILALVGSMTVFTSQVFFVHRVWILGKKYRPLVVVAVLLMLLELAVCFVAAVKGFQLKEWTLFSEWTWLISIHNAASTVSDLFITAVLIYTLRKSRTGIKRTDSMIATLILYAISTGLVTGLYNGVCFLTSVILPHDLIYLGTVIIGIRLYSNSLFAALNSRRTLSERHAGEIALSDSSPFGFVGRPSTISSKPYQSARFKMPPSAATASSGTATFPDSVLDIKVTTDYSRSHEGYARKPEYAC